MKKYSILATTLMTVLPCARLAPIAQAGYDEPLGMIQSTRATSLASQFNKPLPFDIIPARGGAIKITPILHASIQIEYRGKVIIVDPISAGSYRKKADLILITHGHGDHLDKAAIRKLITTGTTIVVPSKLTPLENEIRGVLPVSAGEKFSFAKALSNWSIESVPMYNLVRGPKPEAKFHPKGEGNGYVLTLSGKRIYIAGDTEVTPEMRALKNIDAAFLPMNLPYTMTPQEAAAGARAFKPKVVYPYHFRYPFNKPNTNPQQFAAALQGSGIQVRVLDWYNAAPVARFIALTNQ